MTDDHLSNLFAEGTAPERDAAFALRIDAQIASERRALRMRALAIRTLMILVLAATTFLMVRALDWALAQMDYSAPLIMGVPLPLILAALMIGLAVRFRGFSRFRLG